MATNFHFDEQSGLITLRMTGTVSRDMFTDYSALINDIITDCGQVRLMLVMQDFTMTPDAFFDDLQFSLHRQEGIERVGVVVGHRWHRMMSDFFSSLTHASVSIFENDQEDQAWDWVHEGLMAHAGVRSSSSQSSLESDRPFGNGAL
jgi:hypothetical protein